MHQQLRPLLRGVHPLFRQSSPWSEVLKQSPFGPQWRSSATAVAAEPVLWLAP